MLEDTATTYLDADFHAVRGNGDVLVDHRRQGGLRCCRRLSSIARGRRATGSSADADPITTEVIRHGLNSAAEAIKRTLIRTSMSPIIYEVLDFAAVIYDRQIRLLAQAPSLPLFMGTMSYCIEAAVQEVGGENALAPGDIVLLNNPYQTGSHQQDAAVVMPIFLPEGGELIGYSAIKAHWLDIGAKEMYWHRHDRRLPGGHDLSGREAVQPRRTCARHDEDGDRQFTTAEDRRR